MSDGSDIATIVKGLTEAQRRAMARSFHGQAHVWTWNTQCFDALERKGLANREYGNSGHLTPLGLAVRARLTEGAEHG